MSGGNTTIYGLSTYVGTPATSFRFIAQQTSTTTAVALTGAQVALMAFSTTVTATTVAITGGTIDGTTIGGTTPAAGSFTTVTATGGITASGGMTLSGGLTVQDNGISVSGGFQVLTGGSSFATTVTMTGGASIGTSAITTIGIVSGTGVPSASMPQGTLYLRTDGTSTTTRAYINTTGSTVWAGILTTA